MNSKKIQQIILVGVISFLFAIPLKSQICIGSNAFLQGNSLELGINECASFGPLSSINPLPNSYHNNAGIGALGAVADGGQDGWATGNPNFCGDYFLPGTPVEGWGIEFNGESYLNGNNNIGECGSFDIEQIGSCSVSGNNHIWHGMVNGLDVIQTTRIINSNDLFAVIEIELTNKTRKPMLDVFYARSTDPDNGLAAYGTFETTNAATNDTCSNIVTAISRRCFLALLSSDSRASTSFGGFFMNVPIRNYSLGFGTAPLHNFSGINTDDEAISIGFNLGAINPGETISFKFAYAFNSEQTESALLETDPDNTQCIIKANGIDISTNPTASVTCGEDLNLTVNQPNFTWTWEPTPISVNSNGTSAIVAPTANTVYTLTGTGICTTVTKQIIVIVEDCCKIDPNFSFEIDENCKVTFNNLTTIGVETTGLGVLWDFGDGNTSNDWNPTHYYSTPGSYGVTLTIIGTGKNKECCTEKISKKIKLKCEPYLCLLDVDFDRNYLGGQGFLFDNLTESPSSTTIVGYRWEVNNIFISNSEDLIHTFSKGSHQVCLTVYGVNKKGECCQKTICKKVCLKRKFFGQWQNCTKK